VTLEDSRLTERSADRRIKQNVIRDAAPQKERESRREVDIADPVRGRRCDVRWDAFDPKEEARRRQNPPQPALDAAG